MDNGRAWRVAIVGAGPSAFYAAETVFKLAGDAARIDVFERLPTPFGLVRHGVAPDHQNIKAVVRIYDKVAATPGFRFVGNAALGRDFDVAELAAHYDQIVYAFGCAGSQKLGVAGEDLAGVHAASDFVGWYNDEHLHSALRYVTPSDRHAGRDAAILAGRCKVYGAARSATPRRWTGNTRNWTPVGDVHLNRRHPELARRESAR